MDAPHQQHLQLELSSDEALVLFEFVSRFSESDRLAIADQAEARALWNLRCLLQKQLVEPFLPDYTLLLQRARDRVRDEDEAIGA